MGMTDKQLDKVNTTLGIDSDGIAADAAAILAAHGPDVDVEGRALAPADQAEPGDLVAIYGTGRHRIARVWSVTKGKVSAYYVTPSAVNDRNRAGLPMSGVNYMSVTANRTDAYLFRAFGDVPVTGAESDDDNEPDREPSAAQEAAWDSREDDARGHATSDEAQAMPSETAPGSGPATPDALVLPFPVPAVADQIDEDEGSEQTGDDEMDEAINLPATEDYAPVAESFVEPSVWAPETLSLPTRTMTALRAVQSGKYGPRAAHIAERVASDGIDRGLRATRITGLLRMALYAENEMRAGDDLRLVPEAMAEMATA